MVTHMQGAKVLHPDGKEFNDKFLAAQDAAAALLKQQYPHASDDNIQTVAGLLTASSALLAGVPLGISFEMMLYGPPTDGEGTAEPKAEDKGPISDDFLSKFFG